MTQPRGESTSGTSGGQFTEVDQGAQQQRAFLLRVLDFQNDTPGYQEMKRLVRGALALMPGMTALEIGCGTGDDARAMAELVAPSGQVIGIDSSAFMVEEAQRRAAGATLPLTFAVDDAQRLDFADDTFDRCRCERVLQHVPDAAQAIREMVRVTRPGGRVVVADTDWATAVASDPITQAICAFNGRSIRHATIGRDLGQLFRACGLQHITVQACQLVVAGDELNEDYVQMLQPLVAAAQAAGALSEADAGAWAQTLIRDGRDGIGFVILPCFVVTGTKA